MAPREKDRLAVEMGRRIIDAAAAMGLKVTYVGSLGLPAPHPIFKPLTDRAEVISIAEPGHTDALEFDDGKLMLGKLAPLKDVTWENLVARAGGVGRVAELVGGSRLVAMVNWTMLPAMSDIWKRLLAEVYPNLPDARRGLFVDLADPAKRRSAELREAMRLLSGFQKFADVTLGLNLSEAKQVGEVLKLRSRKDSEFEAMARDIRARLGVGCVVVHPRHAAAAATPEGSASFDGPFVVKPKASTGAGDHFNAGFSVGRVLGMDLAECLCIGVATSGYYVRHGVSPTTAELVRFAARLPPPQR